jgi:hypothetical protein
MPDKKLKLSDKAKSEKAIREGKDKGKGKAVEVEETSKKLKLTDFAKAEKAKKEEKGVPKDKL